MFCVNVPLLWLQHLWLRGPLKLRAKAENTKSPKLTGSEGQQEATAAHSPLSVAQP